VVDDQQRERSRPVGLEHGRFEHRAMARTGRHLDDVLVDAVVELQLLFNCQARQ
jgi:hypothetical protein